MTFAIAPLSCFHLTSHFLEEGSFSSPRRQGSHSAPSSAVPEPTLTPMGSPLCPPSHYHYHSGNEYTRVGCDHLGYTARHTGDVGPWDQCSGPQPSMPAERSQVEPNMPRTRQSSPGGLGRCSRSSRAGLTFSASLALAPSSAERPCAVAERKGTHLSDSHPGVPDPRAAGAGRPGHNAKAARVSSSGSCWTWLSTATCCSENSSFL